MAEIHSIRGVASNRPSAKGLAPVTCYDPYYRRMVHSLRAILADGHPALIRLHAAAEYPATDEKLHKIDLEGHAVLVVGYDDAREAFAVADPWNKAWGGKHSGLRWIGYNELSMIIVDSTKDITTILAPLDVGVSEIETETGIALAVSVGFYAPPGIVIDRDNQDISNIEVQVAWAGGTVNTEQVGRWCVGDKAQLVVEIPPTADRTVTLTVRAAIGGDRPYPYRDTVSVALTRQLEAQTLPQQASVA